MVGMGWQGRGDGIGRSRKADVVLLVGRQGLGSNGGEALPAIPEASIVRLGNIYRCSHTSQSQGDAGGILGHRSHIVMNGIVG